MESNIFHGDCQVIDQQTDFHLIKKKIKTKKNKKNGSQKHLFQISTKLKKKLLDKFCSFFLSNISSDIAEPIITELSD